MSTPPDDPTRISEDTLRSFESDMRPVSGSADSVSNRPPGRHGLLLLLGMAACIAIGIASVLVWLL